MLLFEESRIRVEKVTLAVWSRRLGLGDAVLDVWISNSFVLLFPLVAC